MVLKHFVYRSGLWNLDLNGITDENLLVGKNSVGKSKSIRAIAHVAGIIIQSKNLDGTIYVDFELSDGEKKIYYSFNAKNGSVLSESLIVENGNESTRYIIREENLSTLDGETVNAPKDKLIIHIRRDTIQYPFIEDIINWAQHVNGFSFNEIEQDSDYNTNAWFIGGSVSLFDMIHTVTEVQKGKTKGTNSIVKRMREVGYAVKNVEGIVPENFPEIRIVLLIEDNVLPPLFTNSLSKGMFRTLFTLSLLEYMVQTEKPSLLLIDDFCEGLDYDRSVSVGRMVFDFCKENDIQLITASNDSYLMDVVNLDYWHILHREGSDVSAINKFSDPNLFDDFEFSGLKNIHLLSTDFIARHKK